MSAGTVIPFTPAQPAFTQTISVTNASASITFAAGQGLEMGAVRLVNAGASTVFVRWGVGAQTAVAATDMPILSGTTEVFAKGLADHLAAITASSTATLYVTCGEGS